MISGVFRECSNQKCAFRYPDLDVAYEKTYCPKCGFPTNMISRVGESSINKFFQKSKTKIVPHLDNIRSVYNVGSMLRTCEGFGIDEIVLAGITPTPKHPKMNKTGLGSSDRIKWQYFENGFRKAEELKSRGLQLISFENSSNAIPLPYLDKKLLNPNICIVFGNENLGIDPGILEISDIVSSIPMVGKKESYNVSVAFGIALYFLAIESSI
jgi:tRNA G18 (ribose-2'-O)-methylase SpoU